MLLLSGQLAKLFKPSISKSLSKIYMTLLVGNLSGNLSNMLMSLRTPERVIYKEKVNCTNTLMPQIKTLLCKPPYALLRPFSLAFFFVLTISSLFSQTRTSVQSGDWTTASTWDCTCVPGTTENAIIASGHTVTLTAATTINDFTINSGGIFDYDGNTLTANGTVTPFVSVQTGTYTNGSTWLNGSAPTGGSRVIVVKGHTVTTNGNTETITDLTIDAGAVVATPNNKDISITSNLVVNGTIVLNQGNADLRLTTGPVTVSGAGTIDGAESSQGAMQVEVATTISSGSNLTFLNDIDIESGITLTNNGNIIVSGGDITGNNASSQFTMGTNSDLEIDGALMATGILDAGTNSGNNVEYNGSTGQDVKIPTANTYENLTISGTGTKTIASAITIDGDLTVNAGTFNVNSQNITIEGNWTNSASLLALATVTFSGTSDQGITTNATNFVNLTVNKSSGTVTLNENVIVTGTLTMTQGNIDTGSNSLQLGSGSEGTYSYTAGRIIGTFGRYIGASNVSAQEYPIGTSGNDRTVSITFDDTGGAPSRSAGVVFAQFVESDPGNFASTPLNDNTSGSIDMYNTFNDGYWDFTVNGFSLGGGNNFNLVLSGDGFSGFTIDANTRMVTRATSGDDWAVDGNHNTVSGSDVSRTDITTFVGQFAFGDDTNCARPSDPVISGSTDVCTSDVNDTYSVTLNSGNDYNWTVVGGTIDEAGGGTTTGFTTDLDMITVDWGGTGQVGSVSVVERNGCTTSNTVTVNVNINSIAPASITGSTLVPENETGVAYSVTNDANTTYTWTITGGTQASGTTTNSITVDWESNGPGSVAVTATKTSPSCSASAQTILNVTKYIVVDSDAGAAGCNGNWNDADCWVTGAVPLSTESARIMSGETIALAGGGTSEINNLIISGTLNVNSRDIDVGGDLTINSGGSITGTSGTMTLSGSLSSPQNQIDGTGNTNGAFTIDITNASKTIASTAILTFTNTNVTIGNSLTLTNNGNVTFTGTLDGSDGASSYTTGTNSTTTFTGATAPMATGVMDASASGSTVVYSNGTGYIIPAATYYNLEVANGTHSLDATIDVNGEFTLTSGTFDMVANDMTVAGDLTYTAGTLTSTGTIALDGSANQTVSGAWTIPNLTINNSLDATDAITVSSNITISTILTLTDGIVGSGSNVVTVSNTATGGISGGSTASFVNGILARQTNSTSLYDFPVGEGTTYKRVGITPTATGGSTYQVEPFNAAYSDITTINTGTLTNVSGIEYWDIQRTAGTDAAQVRLYWNTLAASGITSAAELLVGHFTGGPAQWESQGNGANSGDVEPGYVESATAVTTFSPFTFASNSGSINPLPVELLSFEGSIENSSVVLTWSTATELNNDRFEIQKSTDGSIFKMIGTVNGNGNSNTVIHYDFIDRFLTSGLSFYRLKQIDYDGVFEYFPTITINNETFVGLDLKLAPNPTTSDNIRLHVKTDDQLPISITLIGVTGKIHFQEQFDYNQFQGIIKIDPIRTLKPGIYFLRVSQGAYNELVRMSIKD